MLKKLERPSVDLQLRKVKVNLESIFMEVKNIEMVIVRKILESRV